MNHDGRRTPKTQVTKRTWGTLMTRGSSEVKFTRQTLGSARYRQPILRALRLLGLWPGAEDGGADADFCGAFLDGDFEVVGHAHGENGEWQGG